MSMENNEEELLAIKIVSNKNFADAYQLCKVLSWKFGIINCHEIIKMIYDKKYVSITYPKSNTLKFFNLTVDGQKLLVEKGLELEKTLKEKFPKEFEFIDKLFGGNSQIID